MKIIPGIFLLTFVVLLNFEESRSASGSSSIPTSTARQESSSASGSRSSSTSPTRRESDASSFPDEPDTVHIKTEDKTMYKIRIAKYLPFGPMPEIPLWLQPPEDPSCPPVTFDTHNVFISTRYGVRYISQSDSREEIRVVSLEDPASRAMVELENLRKYSPDEIFINAGSDAFYQHNGYFERFIINDTRKPEEFNGQAFVTIPGTPFVDRVCIKRGY